MSARKLFALVLTSVAVSSGAEAQVTTVPETLAGPFATSRKHADLQILTRHYNAGDWLALQSLARLIITEVATAADAEIKPSLDLREHHVALTWVGSDAFGKTLLMRFVVHDPLPELFSADLPGIHDSSTGGALVEVLLTRTLNGRATSVYASTREKDPALDTLPAFVQAIAGPLFGTIAEIAPLRGAPPGAPPPPPDALFATVKRVGMPFKRASVKFKAVARDPWFDSDGFKTGAEALAAKLRFEEVSAFQCGRALATTLADALPTDPDGSCSAAKPDLAKCRAAFDAQIAKVYEAAVGFCTGGKPSDAEMEALQTVDKRFREFVNASLTNTAELEASFRNRPLTKVAFGAGTAVMVKARLTEARVSLEDGVLIADPLNRVMTMAFVNWSPLGYDSDASKITGSERVRVLLGAGLTPDFGFVVGANLLLARGIGVTSGIGVLFAKGARAEEIGAAPADSKDPYRLSVATAPFLGISYNYK